MFWIGFCVGTSLCFLICVVGVSAMGWSVAKDRKAARERPDVAPVLVDYWEKAHRNIDTQNKRLSEILDKLASR